MIELKFYRDDEYVYINNPDGTTSKVSIEEFESLMSGEGGGSDDTGVFIIKKVYDSTTTLDKTFSDIAEKMKNSVCVVTDIDENEENIYNYAEIVCGAYFDENSEENTVVTIQGGFDYASGYVTLNKYSEENGVMAQKESSQLPRYFAGSFSFGKLNVKTKNIYNALTEFLPVQIFDQSAGTNKQKAYTVTEYGHDGTTYYVVLSNGDRYEGLLDADYMTKVST